MPRRHSPASTAQQPPPEPAPRGDERYRQLFTLSPLPSWIYDVETLRFLDVNDAAVRSYGWSREQFLEMSLDDVRAEGAPPLRGLIERAAGRPTRAARSSHRTRDGRLMMVEVTSYPLELDGRKARMAMIHDLTDTLTAQRTVREAEESYVALLDQLTDVFFRTDTAGRWTLLTRSWTALTGFEPRESIGHSFLEYVDPRDHDVAIAVLPRLLAGEVTDLVAELRYRARGGGTRWVEVRARRVLGDDGTILGTTGTLHDVTERHAAAEVARASDARFRAIFDRAAIGIVLAGTDGRVLEANAAYQRFVGYSDEELRGLAFSAYTPMADHPLEREMLRRVATGETESVSFEKRYIRHGGELAWGQLTLSCVVDADGVPQRVIGMVVDITARKAAESSLVSERHFLRALLENLSDGIIACDAQGHVTLYNPTVREVGLAVVGSVRDPSVAPDARVFGVDGHLALTPPELPLSRALRDETVRNEEIVVVPPGRPARTFVANGRAFRDTEGVKLGAVVTLHDITERKAAEVALRAARDEAEAARQRAEEASSAKSDFLARVSHELRTPLNSIIGFAHVLQRNKQGALAETDLTYLERISTNGKHLLAMINDLLDLTRIEAGRMTIDVGPVALEGLIRETTAELEPQLRDRPVALVVAVPPSLPPIETDAARLKQVLINLIGNAVKFTERGEIRVWVDTTPDGAPRAIEVADTGIGIPAGRMEAIFEAFEQAEPTTTRRFGGSGLGLAISRSLCDLLGFRLEARSEEGVGTTMTVVLGDD